MAVFILLGGETYFNSLGILLRRPPSNSNRTTPSSARDEVGEVDEAAEALERLAEDADEHKFREWRAKQKKLWKESAGTRRDKPKSGAGAT